MINNSNIPKNHIYENKYMYSWKEGKVFIAKYKPDALIGLEAAKELVSFRKNIFQNEKYFTLIYVPSNLGCMCPEARKYFASEEATENIIKGAFIVESYYLKILGNAFLYINKPLVPAKIFLNKQDGMKWLLE